MSLLEAVEGVCARLATDEGWHALLLRHELDIKARPLEAELKRTLTVDRTAKGFEDFSLSGQRGIEARNPSRSLLFHALASPNVITDPNGKALELYPTAAEIETVLNYVYGVEPPSLTGLQQQAGEGTALAIVVFAAEYRPKPDTVHRKHADLCFSRTGIARTGTAPAVYDPMRRGFLPWMKNDPQAVCVTPARYYPYIAMQKKGDEHSFGPQSFQTNDDAQDFWVPLHKLFDGPECIAGLELAVDMAFYQINEKLRRFHLRFPDSGWQEPDISQPPFVITDDLVEWANEQAYGKGLLTPVPKTRLVEKATYEGKDVFFSIPQNPNFRGYIINRRYKRRDDGSIHDLNSEPDVVQIVKDGEYQALHFIDFTAEGWVRAACPQLETAGISNAVAYSLVAAPDFYPEYTQRQLLEWSNLQEFPQPFFGQSLRVLSNTRAAGNPDLRGGHFQLEDKGITAIISHPLNEAEPASADAAPAQRQTWLADAAAGSLSPGWEISGPGGGGPRPQSLCAYELGSPFTEDVRICASIGGYWPSVSPDNSRAFEPTASWVPIIPLTDEESGSWDGVNGPQLIEAGDGKRVVEYTNYAFTDYTKNALAGLLSVHRPAQTTAEDYQARILSMHNAFKSLGAVTRAEKAQWSVLSFMKITRPNVELEQAESETGTCLQASVHFYRIYKNDRATTTTPADDFTKRHAEILEMVDLFVSPTLLLIKREQGSWQATELE
ncbi:hypothetical protein HTX81_00955 [Pseudomonas lini]|uniref:hypothetical protein n=1 Tax=Pseudomonas lini TaxID=163011 RepID=UPI000578EB93|nr:hypothetical protein [Pseudomonas lini]NSX07144.1 hypothetical protein [Pseudomonas lini]